MDIKVKVLGVERELDVEGTDYESYDASVGVTDSCIGWKGYHWEEVRELNQKEYDSISEEDNERILEMLTEAHMNDHDEPEMGSIHD